jgi:hypothetical protein
MIEYTREQRQALAKKAIESSGVTLIAYSSHSNDERTNEVERTLVRLYEEQCEQEDAWEDE